MIELSQKKILIIDCQTTGMHPNTGYLLQLGWSIFDPSNHEGSKIEKWTLKLPKSEEIPSKIRKMLHLTNEDILQAVEPKNLFNKLQEVLEKLAPEPIIIAHYAQFEKNFLKQFYLEQTQTNELNFKLFCSQKIAKRLLPHLPSHNLKAISGYFKCANTPKNEVTSHVCMTRHVWQQLMPKLIAANIVCFTGLATWLSTKIPNKKLSYYEYNIERLARLNLSVKPGIYRMLAKDKTILYIGKATSLKARVNSYFRGVKNRDRRKLEMLAQVWEIEVVECDTPLEAALLESDEIKKWSPPYNLLLKSENRKLLFYNYKYTEYKEIKNTTFFHGPYKPFDAVMTLVDLFNALTTKKAVSFGNECIASETLNDAWLIFCAEYYLETTAVAELSVRKFFLIGYALLKQFEALYGKGNFQKWWRTEKKKKLEEDLSLEQKIARKIGRIFIRAAETKRKSRTIWRLYNATLIIQSTKKKLTLINGEIITESSLNQNTSPLFDLQHHDRLSILLSALNNKTIILI